MEVVLLIALGLFAGGITTLAGLGGGLMMTLILSGFVGPAAALALAAPALLIGNTHRVWLFRRDLDVPLARPFVVGAVAGALVGGWITTRLPDWALHLSIVLAMGVAVARQFEVFKYRPGAAAVFPLSVAAGMVTATSGGGGLILGPLLLTTGARGPRFVAIASLVGMSVHIARLVGYGAGGLLSASSLGQSVLLGFAILVGNALAKYARRKITEQTTTRLTYLSLVVCVVLTVIGVT